MGHVTSVPERMSLCETLDRVLNKGAVVSGEILISVADIDLLYLGVQITLTSVETAHELKMTLGPSTQVKGRQRDYAN